MNQSKDDYKNVVLLDNRHTLLDTRHSLLDTRQPIWKQNIPPLLFIIIYSWVPRAKQNFQKIFLTKNQKKILLFSQ